jgi:putative sugar O-methyltransferase
MTPNIRREFFGPRDNFPLSAQDFRKACGWCDTMVALREQRRPYLEANGLDPKVHLPAHMWGQNFVASNFQKIARKDYHTINHMRCLTYNFTGFSMLTMAPCENTPEVLVVPENADAMIRSVARRASEATVSFVRSTQQVPRERIVDTPRMFGESGWDVDGTIVNFDTWSTQQRINALHSSGVIDMLRQRVAERGHARIVEIGAGYGNLAYSLQRMVGPVDYFVVDLPESMIYSSIYLDTVLPGTGCRAAQAGQPLGASKPGFTFVGNHMIGEFLPQIGEVDLVINVMSLSEMSPVQVAHYGNCASRLIGERGVFYEQNYMLPGVHTDIVSILGRELAYGVLLDETQAPHRGRGTARLWANGYRAELWNRGGLTPLASAPDLQSVTIPQPIARQTLAPTV